MRKLVAAALAAVLLFGAWACNTPYLYWASKGYTVTLAYTYPVLPGTPEWKALADVIERREACSVPGELVAKMTTEALLETYLNYPLVSEIFFFNFYSGGFVSLQQHHQFGLNELMQREDLLKVVYERYHAIPIYWGKIPEGVDWEELWLRKEYIDNKHMQYLEVLIAQLDLTGNGVYQSKLRKELYKKDLARKGNVAFYGSRQSTYEWTLYQDAMYKKR